MSHILQIIERAVTSKGEIQLQKRGKDYEIIYNGTFLMATYNGESEKLLVRAALELAPSCKRVLIGGLGVGYSLAEALDNPCVEEVTVVEIESKVIQWNRTYLANFSDNALEDPRVKVVNDDLIKWIFNTDEKYDVICLDIDNGPDWVVFDENNDLYSERGIFRLKELLNYNGVISFWSATESQTFIKRLRKFFENVDIRNVASDQGEPDCIYIASKPKILNKA